LAILTAQKLLFLTVPLLLRPLPWAIRVYPPKLGGLSLSFAITGDEKKSQDEKNTQWKKGGLMQKKRGNQTGFLM
jgi:hypothetical protein